MANIPPIKTVRLQADEVTVETKDASRFVDVDPQQKPGGVDFYILGDTRGGRSSAAEAVPLPDASVTLVKEHAARLLAHVRSQKASAVESSRARFFFGSGRALADYHIGEFNRALNANRLVNVRVALPATGLPPNRILRMHLTFRNEQKVQKEANVSFQMVAYKDGAFTWRLTGYTLDSDGLAIEVSDPAIIKTVEPRLMALYRQSVSGKDGIEAKLRKHFEAILSKRKQDDSGNKWHR